MREERQSEEGEKKNHALEARKGAPRGTAR